jgi:hypothetical protein
MTITIIFIDDFQYFKKNIHRFLKKYLAGKKKVRTFAPAK